MKRNVILSLLMVAFLASFVIADETTDLKSKPAPDFTLKTIDGKTMQLSKQKGHVVMLDFWATWCPPCRKSLPHVEKVSQDAALAAKGLEVYAINAHEAPDTVSKFLKTNKYTFTVPLDAAGTAMNEYSVHGIPTTVIVGKDGNVAEVFIGYGDGSAAQIDAALDKALAAP